MKALKPRGRVCIHSDGKEPLRHVSVTPPSHDHATITRFTMPPGRLPRPSKMESPTLLTVPGSHDVLVTTRRWLVTMQWPDILTDSPMQTKTMTNGDWRDVWERFGCPRGPPVT